MKLTGDLPGRTARGMAWSMAATFGSRLISLAALVVLARLLAPEEFGLLAFALVFLAYLETVGDLGTGAALVYWSRRWQDVAQLTFLANLVMGVVWMGVAIVSAPAVASFFGSAEGEPILRALAFVIPLKALSTTHDALLQRELRFRTRMVPEVVLIATKSAVSVVLAFMGFGVWSLVWGQLAGQALGTVLFWALEPWRPGAYLPRNLIRPVFRYGRGIVAVNVLAAVVHHVDLVIVGRVFGVTVLGFYQMAYRVPDLAVTLVVRISSKVLFPALSRLQGVGGQLRHLYLPALRYLSILTVPATLGLMMLAEPIVLTLFGAQWGASVPILRVIALYTGLKALGSHVGDLLKAVGRPGLLALLGTCRAVVLVPALMAAATRSPLAVAGTLTAVTGVSTVVNLAVACRLMGVSWRELLDALRPSLAASGPLLAFLLLWDRAAGSLPPAVGLAGGTLLGAGLYLFSLWAVAPHVFRMALETVRGPAQAPRVQERHLPSPGAAT